MNSIHRLVLFKNSAAVTIGEIEGIGSGEKWELPVQTDKLTYPLWEHVRFSPHGERILIPIELALGCLFSESSVQGEKGRKRCFALAVVDCKQRIEIGREEVSNADVLKYGWSNTG